MSAVGKTPNGFKLIRISSHTPKNIQEGIAEIICKDIDILSHPRHRGINCPTVRILNLFFRVLQELKRKAKCSKILNYAIFLERKGKLKTQDERLEVEPVLWAT